MSCLITCAPPAERVWSRRLNLKKAASLAEVEIDGTWDFKWPKNAVIRLAFQKPPDEDPVSQIYPQVIEEIVTKLAPSWRTGVRSDERGQVRPQNDVPLTLHFLDRDLLPAPRLGRAARRHQPKLTFDQAVHYDVLISLATLPLVIPKGTQRKKQQVILPRSELGRFARRFEYGNPTAFFGPLDRQEATTQFWTNLKWHHIVVHELGHILGLIHPYQQHDAKVPWKSNDQLKKVLPGLLGQPMTDAQLEHYIDRQLKARLPSPGPSGGPVFSDLWANPSVDLRSVMNPSFVRDLIEGGNGNGQAQTWLEFPDDNDINHLRSMYATTRSKGPAHKKRKSTARRKASSQSAGPP
jgi:hypothetical protein